MSLLHGNPSVIVKKKHLAVVFEYCTEQKIECKFTPREMPDEWEVEFVVSDVMKAINLGMFLKENRMDLAGMASFVSASSRPGATVHSPKVRARKADKEDKEQRIVDTPTLSPAPSPMFDEEESFKKDYSGPIGNEEALF